MRLIAVEFHHFHAHIIDTHPTTFDVIAYASAAALLRTLTIGASYVV